MIRSSAPRAARSLRSKSSATRRVLAALGGVAIVAVVLAAVDWDAFGQQDQPPAHPKQAGATPKGDVLTSRALPTKPALKAMTVGQEIQTEAGQRQILALPGGATLYINEKTQVKLEAGQSLVLAAGEIFVQQGPSGAKKASAVMVQAPGRKVTGQNASFSVKTQENTSAVLVTRGQVQLSGFEKPMQAGQILLPGDKVIRTAPRPAQLLHWTHELMVATDPAIAPSSQYTGGALVAVDPDGQESKLSLRKYHIDVHIEDGFARTTIDQTYFNHENFQTEGTFYFPLPPDASLSRLAMYVEGELMEGGMVDRDYGQEVYETIKYLKKDPALLEWVDGSTFKMRVFPLEARKEKRIILSYTQKLPGLHGQAEYRFPAGHSLPAVKDWSLNIRVKQGSATTWASPSHTLQNKKDKGDLLLTAHQENALFNKDVVLQVSDPALADNAAKPALFAVAEHEGQQYLMAALRPDLLRKDDGAKPPAGGRNWLFLFESSGDRDPLLARVQIEVMRHLLLQAGPEDTFNVLTANTKVRALAKTAQPISAETIAEAVTFLEGSHLIGALDLGQALSLAAKHVENQPNSLVVHLGSGMPAMGERQLDVLAKAMPQGVQYVGVGIGKRWNRNLMKAAAEHSGGYFTQINPDESIAWRSFELASTLQTLGPPGLRKIAISGVIPAQEKGPNFLYFNQLLAQGEEFCAVTRLDAKAALPKGIKVKFGDGQEVEVPLAGVKKNADYLPRMWAKLEIDRLLKENAAENKKEIVALSKAMYVMTPYTSLLVLENEDMYKQYGVDKGRKDHWAMYPAPQKIEVVYEPDPTQPIKGKNAKSPQQVLNTIAVLGKPKVLAVPLGGDPVLGTDFDGDVDLAFKHEPHKGKPAEFFFEGIAAGENGKPFKKQLEKQKMLQHLAAPKAEMPADEMEIFRAFPAAALKLSDKVQNEFGPPQLSKIPHLKGIFKDIEGLGKLQEAKKMSKADPMAGPGGFEVPPASLSGSNGIAPLQNPAGGAALGGKPGLGAMPPKAHKSMLEEYLNDDRLSPEQKEKVSVYLEVFGRAADKEATMKPFGGSLAMMGEQIGSSGSTNPYLYSRPNYTNNESIFSNLLAYAPGMNTSAADALAVLEAEAFFHKPLQKGKIDPAAQALIDKARKTGWQKLTVPGKKGEPDFSIVFDGQGRFVFTQTLPPGLDEQVICDGKSLLHLYPQLGLGAKRNVSRFHRAGFSAMLPWVVAPTEDLAKGADVKSVDDNSVDIIAHRAKTKPVKDKDGKIQEPIVFHLRLVFADNGALAERQIVEMPKNKVLVRQLCAANGSIRWLDGKGKELSIFQAKLGDAKQPNLSPKTTDLVVLDLPYRTPEQVRASLKIENKSHGQLTFAQATTLLASYIATGNGGEARNIFQQALHNRNERQLGYYVLLAAAGQDLGGQNLNVVEDHPDAPLAQYLALHTSPTLRQHASQWAVGSVQWQDPMLKHLATTHALYQRWQSKQMEKWTPDRLQKEREQALKYVRDHQDSAFGWVMLSLLQNKAGTDSKRDDKEFFTELAKHWELFQQWPVLDYAARYEQARCLADAGQEQKARTLFLKLYQDTFKDGYLPPLDGEFRAVMLGGKGAESWSQLLQTTAQKMIADKQRPAVLALAWQCWQLNDGPQANQLISVALNGIKDKKEQDGMKLAAVLFYQQTKQLPQADTMLSKLLDDPKLAQRPELWRLASKIASERQLTAKSLECLEKALDLEFKDLPEVVNLQQIRNDYGSLLGHYESLAESLVALKINPPQGFLSKVIKTADRWRSLDPQSDKASNATATILRTLGEKDLGWDYLTTPIAMRPNEPGPWLNLASNLKLGGDPELAELAYKAAFESEPTNAQTLWDRAENLHQSGKTVQAQTLYGQIAEGHWGPQYQGLVTQAKLRLK